MHCMGTVSFVAQLVYRLGLLMVLFSLFRTQRSFCLLVLTCLTSIVLQVVENGLVVNSQRMSRHNIAYDPVLCISANGFLSIFVKQVITCHSRTLPYLSLQLPGDFVRSQCVHSHFNAKTKTQLCTDRELKCETNSNRNSIIGPMHNGA